MNNAQLNMFRQLAAAVQDEESAIAVTPSPVVGDLAVFLDYKLRHIGCRVVKLYAAGEISREAYAEIRVVGDQDPYTNGMKLVVEQRKLSKAV